jgi:hypothetical protein
MPASIPGENLAMILQSGPNRLEDLATRSQGMAEGDQSTRTANFII